MNEGYIRQPAVYGETVVFVCEDDLWTVPLAGGVARRLTAGKGDVSRPAFSADGSQIAFTSSEEQHPEVFVMPATGGEATRLTFLGCSSMVRGWTRDGRIAFASDVAQPFGARVMELHSVAADGGSHQTIPVGPAREIAWGSGGGVVIGRHTIDPARWKRYRGGTAGQLWVDATGSGEFVRILEDVRGNIGSPMWIGDRVYFVSDHEGTGNIYSCQPDGGALRRHTHHEDFYARFPSTDGTTIVYHAGADLYRLDPAGDAPVRVDVQLNSPRTQRNRKFVTAASYLDGYALHPDGHSVAVEARGKAFTMPLWEGATRQWGVRDGVRYRHGQWMHDGETFVAVSDDGGEEGFDVFSTETSALIDRLDIDVGRVTSATPSPVSRTIAVTNHRFELLLVDLDAKTSTVLDFSEHGAIGTPTWSPDGAWIAYGFSPTERTSCIRLIEVESRTKHQVTRPDFRDFAPSFDPTGTYLYFLSLRQFDPVYDHHFFDLGFPRGVKPMLVTLQADTPSPFVPKIKGLGPDAASKPDTDANADADAEGADDAADGDGDSNDVTPIKIDVDGIDQRVLAFPVPDGNYDQIHGIKDKVLFTAWDVRGALKSTRFAESSEGRLEVFSFVDQQHETLVAGITSFAIARDGTTLVYRTGNRLRALKAGDKPSDSHGADASRRTGWLDMSRIRISVNPIDEWRQMLREAWRLQRDHFWTADMSGIDWDAVLDRYLPLVGKVASRVEFSDLMWEMQGELGTSHAYEMGGDHRQAPAYGIGMLGADIERDAATGLHRIARIVPGDSWNPDASSPLAAPGLNVSVGDTLLAVAGQPVDAATSPHELLVNQAGMNVALTIGDADGGSPREVVVKALRSEQQLRYRDWVETNRRIVHERTGGEVGYVHVPDMGAVGYSEFHRYLSSELDSKALIVDVRFNGGGHVSQLVLEKLARTRMGYAVSRWGAPESYPSDAPLGPIVAVTNEQAGSDGDIFSHCFKYMEIGPLVGTRTWGGVIGINPSHRLADGSMTTQPEYSFWFNDAAWGIENHGADPDHVVEITPQDHVAGRDPQLDTALDLIAARIAAEQPAIPEFADRPNLCTPALA